MARKAAPVKEAIIEAIRSGRTTLDEIISYVSEKTGKQPRIIKGIITKMVKRGELRRTDNTFELVE